MSKLCELELTRHGTALICTNILLKYRSQDIPGHKHILLLAKLSLQSTVLQIRAFVQL